MGVGVIIRDAVGTVVAAMCSTVPYITDPAVAEATALWKAVTLCLELNIQRLHLEGDAKEIVQALQKRGPCRSRYGPLIEASLSSLNGISDWSVTHTKREANEAAHRLAKAAVN